MKSFIKILLVTTATSCLSWGSLSAQQNCVTIQLRDTVTSCGNRDFTIPIQVTMPTGTIMLDTQWAPSSGLRYTDPLLPTFSIGNTSAIYTITMTALSSDELVVNGDFSNGDQGFTSNYTSRPNNTPMLNEGEYSVATNPRSVHGGFSSFTDHTSGTGNMIVVNGSSNPNTSIWCQTITVQPNTDYDFSAWMASAHPSQPAILQFSINGNLLGNPVTLSSIPGRWTQFHIPWNSGTSTTATICIVNQNTAYGGNDFAIDDISFREYCVVSDSIYFLVREPEVSINAQITGCAEVLLSANYPGGDESAQYTWTLGDGYIKDGDTITHKYDLSAQYNIILTMSDTMGCHDTVQQLIDVVTKAEIIASQDTTVCSGAEIQLWASSSDSSYHWSPSTGLSATNIANPTATILHTITYNVTTVSEKGCEGKESVTITVDEMPADLNASYDGKILTCKDNTTRLSVAGDYSYQWSPAQYLDNATSATPMATINPPATTTFTVQAKNERGCTAQDTVTVFADPQPSVFIPDAFTPNGDGRNDRIRPVVYCNQSVTLRFRIFNRWGEVIYDEYHPGSGWDGTYKGLPQTMGTYFYNLEGGSRSNDGSTVSIKYNGTFILVR